MDSIPWRNAFLFFLVTLLTPIQQLTADLPGTWEILVTDAGISSMHTAVTRFNTVVLLDHTHGGPTHKLLPPSLCRNAPMDDVSKRDCYAHSVVFDPQTNGIRTLLIHTNTMCSGGGFMPDGTLLQAGGDLEGIKKFRKFEPCEPTGSCDWEEIQDIELADGRWYATNQILPDGTFIIVGGRGTNTVEYYPPRGKGAVSFPFLAEAEDSQMDNLYPYVHLLPNGHLFVFANNRAVMYDHRINAVLKEYPPLVGGPRNYPSGGSSAMLSIRAEDYSTAEVLVCGGAQYGAFIKLSAGSPARESCGRIVATAPKPEWIMEDMPFGRIMGDMVLLPTGEMLIINGAKAGAQGFEMASDPCLHPVLYRPDQPIGLRFMTLAPGTVPRMYHSTANLLPDGRVLLAGSNPHYLYKFNTKYPTELRIEAFSPEYLSPDRTNLRPAIEKITETVRYGARFDVVVSVALPVVGIIDVNMGSAPYATHSFSQGQRMVKLSVGPAVPEGGGKYRIQCTAPPTGAVAPPGYYMTFAVNQGIPSVARWVRLVQ